MTIDDWNKWTVKEGIGDRGWVDYYIQRGINFLCDSAGHCRFFPTREKAQNTCDKLNSGKVTTKKKEKQRVETEVFYCIGKEK